MSEHKALIQKRCDKRHPKKYLIRLAKYRAKIFGREFDITDDDFEIPEFCPILGVKLTDVREASTKESSPCLDRIDNSLGYVKGNVAVISFRANKFKSNFTNQEIASLYKYVFKSQEPG